MYGLAKIIKYAKMVKQLLLLAGVKKTYVTYGNLSKYLNLKEGHTLVKFNIVLIEHKGEFKL